VDAGTLSLKSYSLRSVTNLLMKVLPTVDRARKVWDKIIKLPNTIHNDMNDRGNKKTKEINAYIGLS
jgi:hypothetical protein